MPMGRALKIQGPFTFVRGTCFCVRGWSEGRNYSTMAMRKNGGRGGYQLEFLLGKSVWVYVLIFFGKILEVTISTSRMVLINRGERLKGSVLAFFEIALWLLITGTVVVGLTSDPFKVLVFALAFAVGNYLGSWMEDKLAFGLSTIEIISPGEGCEQEMLRTLRSSGFAVTVMDGQGKDGQRKVMLMHMKRKRIPEAMRIINETRGDCLITVTDVRVLRGGYIVK